MLYVMGVAILLPDCHCLLLRKCYEKLSAAGSLGELSIFIYSSTSMFSSALTDLSTSLSL